MCNQASRPCNGGGVTMTTQLVIFLKLRWEEMQERETDVGPVKEKGKQRKVEGGRERGNEGHKERVSAHTSGSYLGLFSASSFWRRRWQMDPLAATLVHLLRVGQTSPQHSTLQIRQLNNNAYRIRTMGF